MMKILLLTLLSLSVYSFVPSKFHLELEQSFKSKISGKLKKSQGELFFLAPNSIKFKITAPKKKQLTFIRNEKGQTWYYTPPRIAGEQATIRTGIDVELPLLSIIERIKNGIKSNKDFSVVQNKNHFLLQFNKAYKHKVKLQAAQLIFKNHKSFSTLKKVIFTDLDGQDVRLLVKKVDPSALIKKSEFDFRP